MSHNNNLFKITKHQIHYIQRLTVQKKMSYNDNSTALKGLANYALVLSFFVVLFNVVAGKVLIVRQIKNAGRVYKPEQSILISLCCANFLVGFASLVHFIFFILDVKLPYWIIYLTSYQVKFALIASLLHILLLTLERLISVRFPFYHRNHINKKKIVCLLVLLWIAGLVPAAGSVGNKNTAKQSLFLLTLSILMFVADFLIIAVYAYIIYVVRKTSVKPNPLVDPHSHILRIEIVKRERKATVTAFVVVLSFLVCTLPSVINMFVASDVKRPYYDVTFIFMFTLLLLRSILDPIVYILRRQIQKRCNKISKAFLGLSIIESRSITDESDLAKRKAIKKDIDV